MRILHVIPSLSPTEGGPSYALPLMAEALAGHGVEIVTATTDDRGRGKRDPQLCREIVRTGFEVRHHFPKQSDFYKVSIPLARWVAHHVHSFDAVHVHALFSHASVSAAEIARRAGIPYVIRPLGVLNQYGVKHHRNLLKKLSIHFRESHLLRDAAAVHFTSREEAEEAALLGLPMRDEIIRLGLRFSDEELGTHRANPPYALFLSRLDPKKNLEGLLRAWGGLPPAAKEGWKLRIAGDGDAVYKQSLELLVRELAIGPEIEWLGHVAGENKERLLREASLFVLPSFSENFGIAAAEAMGAGTPCLLAPGVAVGAEAYRAGGCFLAQPEADAIGTALSEILPRPESREATATKGREFARREYGLERMGRSLEQLYRRITNSPRVS